MQKPTKWVKETALAVADAYWATKGPTAFEVLKKAVTCRDVARDRQLVKFLAAQLAEGTDGQESLYYLRYEELFAEFLRQGANDGEAEPETG